jgi:hypothetical protein
MKPITGVITALPFGQNNSLGEFHTISIKADGREILLTINKDQLETYAAKLGIDHRDLYKLVGSVVEINIVPKN